jgi:membrane protease YdiL (CAAX protease family)
MVSGFFAPWKEDKQAIWIASVVGFLMIVSLFGIYINFQGQPADQTQAMIFLLMMIFGIIVGGLDWANKSQSHPVFEFVQFGSVHKLLFAGAAGIVLTLIWTGSLFTAVPPTLAVTGTLAFIYVVVIAPYCEEKFFASIVAPTGYKLFGGVLGLIVASAIFGSYHGFAYGWEYNKMVIAGIWRMLVLIGNQFFKSTSFSLFAHITNNYIAYTMIV